jgi:hypothetical protein
MNLYSYVVNSPTNYLDPNGLWTIQIGVSGSGGIGLGGTTGFGMAFSYSKEKGFQSGFYSTNGGGLSVGASISGMIDATVSNNDSICELRGGSIAPGGSLGEGLVGGGEVNIMLGDSKTSYTGSFGIGGGTPVEGHLFYTDTKVKVLYDSRKKKGISK